MHLGRDELDRGAAGPGRAGRHQGEAAQPDVLGVVALHDAQPGLAALAGQGGDGGAVALDRDAHRAVRGRRPARRARQVVHPGGDRDPDPAAVGGGGGQRGRPGGVERVGAVAAPGAVRAVVQNVDEVGRGGRAGGGGHLGRSLSRARDRPQEVLPASWRAPSGGAGCPAPAAVRAPGCRAAGPGRRGAARAVERAGRTSGAAGPPEVGRARAGPGCKPLAQVWRGVHRVAGMPLAAGVARKPTSGARPVWAGEHPR